MLSLTTSLILPLIGLGDVAPPQQLPSPTKVEHQASVTKLVRNSGIALQWISWQSRERGKLTASWSHKILSLDGSQLSKDGSARLAVSGNVTRIGKNDFVLNGTIWIENAPEVGRYCTKTGEWRFAITQNRKYWRLRDFEWCDQLTDYIDIYF
jgi:hypothetical protein